MSCKDLAIKMERLQEDFGSVAMTAFEQELSNAIGSKSGLAAGVVDALTVDLTYCIYRHQGWHKVEVFPDLLQDLVAARYKLPVSRAEPIVETALRVADRILPEPDHDLFLDSQVFLRRIFVATATAANERELYLNLGLGPGLIQRMRASVAGMAYGPGRGDDDGIVQFIPELDAAFGRILLELSRCLKQSVWALDYFRLFDALITVGSPWPERLTKTDLVTALQGEPSDDHAELHPVLKIYQQLVAIAVDGQLPTDKTTSVNDLADAFVAAKLAMPREGFDHHRQKPSRWLLQPLGQAIVAEGFYHLHVKGRPLAAGKLLGWPELIQRTVIQQSPLRELSTIKDLVMTGAKHKRSLTPGGMKAAINYLAHNLSIDDFTDTVQHGVKEQGSAWTRKALIEALVQQPAAKVFRQGLWHEMAQFDPSPMVRETALQLLIQAGHQFEGHELATLAMDTGSLKMHGGPGC